MGSEAMADHARHPLVGLQLAGATLFVERGKVRELALALGEDDPVFRDEAAARAAGFERIPAPPTFTTTIAHWLGADMGIGELGLDLRRLLHGEASWEYLAPVYVGDELRAERCVTDVTTRDGKRGGTMTLVTVTTDFINQDGTTVIRHRDLLIETAKEAS